MVSGEAFSKFGCFGNPVSLLHFVITVKRLLITTVEQQIIMFVNRQEQLMSERSVSTRLSLTIVESNTNVNSDEYVPERIKCF